MESLLKTIDELIETERLRGRRDGNFVFIDMDRSDRTQKVHLKRKNDAYEFSSVVAKVNDVTELSEEGRNALLFRIWRRNALKPVVSLSTDGRDRVVGTVTCPVQSTHAEEIEFYLTTLARDCDRFEYILSGSKPFSV